MKRLTGKYKNGTAYYNIIPGESTIDRLAAIEDILGDEYELEQIQGVFDEWHHYLEFASERNAIESTVSDIYDNGNVDWNRLRELVKADREGRCVVFPCDPGEIVWAVNRYEISSHQIRQFVRDKCGDFACSLLKFPLEDFGQKVFLTRQEAEAALKAREGRKMALTDWSDKIGINPSTLRDRIKKRGWSVERAIEEPVRRKNGGNACGALMDGKEDDHA